jgi:uncharacterized SAM-binding protein YcdF (DUF218 family)
VRRRLIGAAVGAAAGFLARDLAVDSMASFWVPWAVLGAMLWTRRLRAIVVGMAGVLLALWVAVAFTPLVPRLAEPLVRRDAMGPAEAVLVLSSRVQSDGEPSAAALSRLVHGLGLVREAQVERLIVTEMAASATPHAALAGRLARRLGITAEIIPVGPVRRTRDEAVEVSALCRRRGWHRLLVVTSPTHSRRACAAVAHEGLDVVCSPALETEFDVETLDRPSERLVAFRSVLHEWAGIWYYRRKGWS